MDDLDTEDVTRSAEARTFLLITVAAGLTAWDIGWDLGAFETFSYTRLFVLTVVSVVLFVASWTDLAGPLLRRPLSRFVTGLPLAYFVADFFEFTDSGTLVGLFVAAWLITSPFTLYLFARALGGDFFGLRVRYRWLSAAIVGAIFLGGLSVGLTHERFVSCDDFARNGDFVPESCAPTGQP